MSLAALTAAQSVLEDYAALLAEVDGWFARCNERYGSQIACRPGCAECCRGLFDITLLDAYLLKSAFDRLPLDLRAPAEKRARDRLHSLQAAWPEFQAPYLLNGMPDEEWTEMPEEDDTSCPLLHDGRCLLYAHRPMICRLHGLPNIDHSGKDFSAGWCTLNFAGAQPLKEAGLRWHFRRTFEREIELFREFSRCLTGDSLREADTFIPTALLIDFAAVDWRGAAQRLPRR